MEKEKIRNFFKEPRLACGAYGAGPVALVHVCFLGQTVAFLGRGNVLFTVHPSLSAEHGAWQSVCAELSWAQMNTLVLGVVFLLKDRLALCHLKNRALLCKPFTTLFKRFPIRTAFCLCSSSMLGT